MSPTPSSRRPRKSAAPQEAAEQLPGSLGELTDAPYNPRRISDLARAGLRRSLVEFGDVSGVTYNFRTGNLVAGHRRREELATLDPGAIEWAPWRETGLGRERWGDVEVAGGTRFRVRGVDWPVTKEKAANVAANSPLISGEFTFELQALLDEIRLGGEELFGALRFDDLQIDIPSPPEEFSDVDPDAVAAGLEHECPRCGFKFS